MSGELLRFEYRAPNTVEEACSLLSRYKDKARVIAGGTDLLISMKSKQIMPQEIINLKTIPDLDYIHYADEEGLRIGALATMHDIESSPIIQERFPMLASAASHMGSPGIRNMATIAGNVCRAAPSADTATPLLALKAKLKLVSVVGERIVSLEEFFIGPGESVLRSDEILTELQIPNPPPNTLSAYVRSAAREAVAIAQVVVSVVVTLEKTGVVDARIFLGAVAPTPVRATQAEEILKGKAIDDSLIEEASQAALAAAKPISDIRCSDLYRNEMIKVLVYRALRQVTFSA
jgi:carbon-monoxide dehydrogenase medium subunit